MFSCIYLAGFLKTLSSNGPFPSNSFFRPKTISRVAHCRNWRVQPSLFFLLLLSWSFVALSFSPFLFLRYCDFGAVLRLKKPAFWRFFSQTTANFVTNRLVFQKWVIYIYIYIYIHYNILYTIVNNYYYT